MTRLDRLTAILIHLQTRRVVRAQELASRFKVSLRTIYRDLRSLETAGVPIGAEAGVGYFLTDYHLPPVMFTNAEASSLVFGAKLMETLGDESVRSAFESALFKIKSVLKPTDQEHINDLIPRILVARPHGQPSVGGTLLNELQRVVACHHIVELCYRASYAETETRRIVEPIGLYHYGTVWHLIGFCQTRQDYRDFRLDRIQSLTDTGERFARHARLTLPDYLTQLHPPDMPTTKATVVFSKNEARYIQDQRHYWGFTGEEDLGNLVRMHFCTPHLEGLAHWLLSYGNDVAVESPAELLTIMKKLVAELRTHYDVC